MKPETKVEMALLRTADLLERENFITHGSAIKALRSVAQQLEIIEQQERQDELKSHRR